MKRQPKICIVTPSYNQADYLEQTIQSVLDQDCDALEYVVIDGGSSDGSVDIIRKYDRQLSCWVSEPDHGHADGLNKGFSRTSAGIMGWINSSDVYYPWTLKTVVQIFDALPHVQWISGMPTHISDFAIPRKVGVDVRNRYDFLAGHYNWLQQESIFWRRDLWNETGGRLNGRLNYACDFDLWLRFFRVTSLSYVNTILAGFRTHKNQRGSIAIDSYRAEARDAFAAFRESTGYRDRLRAALIRVTNRPAGRILRAYLKQLGLIPWYRHPQITYNFETSLWEWAPDWGQMPRSPHGDRDIHSSRC